MKTTAPGPLRLGLIGCGGIAFWAHLRSLRGLGCATLTAVADPDPLARRRAAGLTRAPLMADVDALLERDDVDAVLIAAPTQLHAPLAIAAARAGKHLYVEKPLATDADGAHAVRAAVNEASLYAMVGFNRRFHPVHEQARQLLRAGCIGRVRSIQTAFCEPVTATSMPGWKRQRSTGGGVLLDLASHHFDLVRWFLNDEVATVRAVVASHATEQDTASVHLTLLSGITVQSHFSFQAGPADVVEFFGEGGTLRVDRHRAAPELRVHRRLGYGVRSAWVTRGPGDVSRQIKHWLRPSQDPSFRRALAAFVERVRGQANEGATLLDGARSLALVLAAEAAAASGGLIQVSAIGEPDPPATARR